MADYRNTSGIVLDDGPYGPTLTIEDSSRVDPWIVRQAQREAASCTERLAEFSRRDRHHVGRLSAEAANRATSEGSQPEPTTPGGNTA